MDIERSTAPCHGIRFSVSENGVEIGRTTLFILENDLHARPFGFIEDVYVDPMHRGKGIAQELVKKALTEAKNLTCYKVILTSRFEKEKVHELYKKLGFALQGYEFRVDFKASS